MKKNKGILWSLIIMSGILIAFVLAFLILNYKEAEGDTTSTMDTQVLSAVTPSTEDTAKATADDEITPTADSTSDNETAVNDSDTLAADSKQDISLATDNSMEEESSDAASSTTESVTQIPDTQAANGSASGTSSNTAATTATIAPTSTPALTEEAVSTVDNDIEIGETDLTGLIDDIDEVSTLFDEEEITETNDSITYVTFNGSDITITGSGCKESDGNLLIKSSGTYVLSGTFTGGFVIINVDEEEAVELVLNGVIITNTDGAAIYIKDSPYTQITLMDGTTNKLTDGSEYVYEDAENEEPSATLFSKDDLTITGTGTLIIDSNFKDAIVCKDTLTIESGTFTITSVDDGIIGRDMLLINDGTFTIDCAGDGLKSTNDETTETGSILIKDGVFMISSDADGIQAVAYLAIEDGDFTILSGVASINYDSGDASAKCLKANTSILIGGGTFDLTSQEDTIHSDAIITIDGGTFTLDAEDDGIHSDTQLTINAGTIIITASYEGLEGTNIDITGGNITVNASDDGINVAGGTDSLTGGSYQDTFSSAGSRALNISGGTITVTAAGDGLDANGSIYISGGTIYVNGPTSSGNGALDYDAVCQITGGELVLAGSSGMAQAPDSSSTQNTLAATFLQTMSSGTVIEIKDSSGNTVLSYTLTKNAQSFIVSLAALKTGSTYTLYANGSSQGSATISSVITYINGSSSGGTLPGSTSPGGTMPGNRR